MRAYFPALNDPQIVENDSSGLDHKHERKQGINANHVDMCKFASSGRTDLEYRDKVETEIRRHVTRMSARSSKEQQSQSTHALEIL